MHDFNATRCKSTCSSNSADGTAFLEKCLISRALWEKREPLGKARAWPEIPLRSLWVRTTETTTETSFDLKERSTAPHYLYLYWRHSVDSASTAGWPQDGMQYTYPGGGAFENKLGTNTTGTGFFLTIWYMAMFHMRKRNTRKQASIVEGGRPAGGCEKLTENSSVVISVPDPWHFGTDPDPDPCIRTLDNGSGLGSCCFRLWLSRCQQSLSFFKIFFVLLAAGYFL